MQHPAGLRGAQADHGVVADVNDRNRSATKIDQFIAGGPIAGQISLGKIDLLRAKYPLS